MLERKRCVPFPRAAYVGGGIKQTQSLGRRPLPSTMEDGISLLLHGPLDPPTTRRCTGHLDLSSFFPSSFLLSNHTDSISLINLNGLGAWMVSILRVKQAANWRGRSVPGGSGGAIFGCAQPTRVPPVPSFHAARNHAILADAAGPSSQERYSAKPELRLVT